MSTVKNNRLSFGKSSQILEIPDLLTIQKESFDLFINKDQDNQKSGLQEILEEISPIEDFSRRFELKILDHYFKEPQRSIEECRITDQTYSRPLHLVCEFTDRETGGLVIDRDIFLGDFTIMTRDGTFVINGTERVIVSQLVRSPGVYFSQEVDKTSDRDIFIGKIIPGR